jgi:hypothetical protein
MPHLVDAGHAAFADALADFVRPDAAAYLHDRTSIAKAALRRLHSRQEPAIPYLIALQTAARGKLISFLNLLPPCLTA